MLSTLAIISIFTEIFAAGVLVAGGGALWKNFVKEKKLSDLWFGLAFFSLFIYVAAIIASQIMFNLGLETSWLVYLYKTTVISLLVAGTALWAYVVDRFSLTKISWSRYLVFAIGLLFIGFVVTSSSSLLYREEIAEPVVVLSVSIPALPLLASMWALLVGFSFASAAAQAKGGRRTLSAFLGFSSLIMLSSMLADYLYLQYAEPTYMILAWLLMLVASLGLLAANLIQPDAPEAKSPLLFFRSRILFKLMLIFVLLIVILFEATTLATINISKQSLSQSIINNYLRVAEDLADEVRLFSEQPSRRLVQKVIAGSRVNGKEVAFLVDSSGKLLAHPEEKRVVRQEDVSRNEAVALALAGKYGGGEFRDELGVKMVGAYVPITRFGWGIIVEEPMVSAYTALRILETNSLIFVIFGILLTALVGVFFARSIERPIKELTRATEAVSKGDLYWHVTQASADEIGQLTTAFNQMTKDLRESQERLVLSEKMGSLGTMAAGMAHEIKNPLVSIRTFTQILQQKWEDPEFRQKFSSIIPHEIERINKIAESLLKFGRPMKPELSRVEVNSLLDEVLLLFESECKKNNIRVIKKMASLPEVTGDAGQLQQVFVNLVKNGIESMTKNGGSLVVKTDVGEISYLGKMQREGKKRGEEMVWGEEEKLEKPMPVILIEIADTGEGISEEGLKRLFDPFFTTKMTGTGMGLPITLRIIEEHHGSIKIRSVLNKGTSFILTLPQA